MKVGIDSYCYHRFLGDVYPEQQPPAAPLTMDRVIDRAHEMGCEGISLESCFFPSFDPGYLADVRARLDAYSFDRVYAWGHPDGLEAGRNPQAKDDMIRHIHHANHGSRRRRAGGQGRDCLGRLCGALRRGGLRWALTLRLPLPLGLAWYKPSGLVLRCRHHGEGEQSGKDKANHGAIIPC
jgi:hypothetical protein